jgi:hypothetical protein
MVPAGAIAARYGLPPRHLANSVYRAVHRFLIVGIHMMNDRHLPAWQVGWNGVGDQCDIVAQAIGGVDGRAVLERGPAEVQEYDNWSTRHGTLP